MPNSYIKSLSEYQIAVLREMGISVWQYLENPAMTLESQSEVQPVASGCDIESISDPLAISGKALLLMSTDALTQGSCQDIMHCLQIELDKVIWAKPNELSKFTEYRIAIVFGDSLSFEDRVLVLPPIEQLESASIKRELWQLIQKI